MKTTPRILASIIVAAICVFASHAQGFLSGQVVDVLDGKTVVIVIPNGKVTVELQYIDVPVEGTMGDTVREHLKRMLLEKQVSFRAKSFVGELSISQLFINGTDVSQQMLRDGAAWHMPTDLTAQDPAEFERYALLETAAKKDGLGVWSRPDLQPIWENPRRENIAARKPVVASARRQDPKPGYWGDKNPRMGDIGALFNGYNAATKQGYLSTGTIALHEIEGFVPFNDAQTALDITYYYKEERKVRVGRFVITLAAASESGYFANNNNLILYHDNGVIDLGKPVRSVAKSNGRTIETLRYEVTRSAIDKMINTEGTNLRVKDCNIYLIMFKYLLYNMLDAAK